jgi:hypothetical protein
MQTINNNGTAAAAEIDNRSQVKRISVHGLAVNDIPADSSIHLEVEVDGDWKRGGVSWSRGDENTVRAVELLEGDNVRAVVDGTAISGTWTVKLTQ